ncbi:hypothetical protein ZWY2020_050980, partial [Hordeum vulgare]
YVLCCVMFSLTAQDVDDYDTQDCGAEDVNINGNKDAVGAKDNHIEDINPMENGKSAEEYVCGSSMIGLNPIPFGVELEAGPLPRLVEQLCVGLDEKALWPTMIDARGPSPSTRNAVASRREPPLRGTARFAQTTNYASQLRRHRPPAPLQRRQPPPPTAARRLPQLDHLLPELTRNSTSLRATPSSSYAGWEVVDRRNRPCLLPLRPPFPTRGRRRPSSHVFPEPFKRIRVIFRSSRPPSPSQSLAISPSRRGSPLAAA